MSADAGPTDFAEADPANDPVRTAFVRQHLRLKPVAGLDGLHLYLAHPGTGLSRLLPDDADDAPAPYWAWCWAGGLALARHFAAHPECVAGRRVLDLGAGGGIVSIAAARAGAHAVVAAEIDPYGRAALALNAAANGVHLRIASDDLLPGPPPAVEVVALGDLFYEARLAHAVTVFLDRCLAAGITVLVGDPGRKPLPLARLHRIATYRVADFGDPSTGASRESGVFLMRPPGGKPV